ncbi:hypothetical protein ACRWUW_01765 [Escherichia coli]
MESNIKGLVAAGYEMASELKAECGAVDMRSVAKLISDLATQLEVQLVRANELAEDQQKAIESIKQADAAVKLAHEKFSVLAAENAELNKFIVQSCYVFYGEQDEISDAYICAIDGRMPQTPATDAFLADVRAVAFNELRAAFVRHAKVAGLDDGDLVTVKEATDALLHCAEQLREGGNQ